MKNKREIDQATATNPYPRGILLTLHHGDDGRDVGQCRDPSGGGSGGVSPSNLRWFLLCFGVYAALSSRKPWDPLYRGF